MTGDEEVTVLLTAFGHDLREPRRRSHGQTLRSPTKRADRFRWRRRTARREGSNYRCGRDLPRFGRGRQDPSRRRPLPRSPTEGSRDAPCALYALAVATFAIGTTEFVVVGLFPGIAADLSVSIPTAGLLVSLYALSITLGTPIFSALTRCPDTDWRLRSCVG
jgi:hypothetical protein